MARILTSADESISEDDFKGVEQFGIRVMTAQEFLRAIGELPEYN